MTIVYLVRGRPLWKEAFMVQRPSMTTGSKEDSQSAFQFCSGIRDKEYLTVNPS